ncbi:MAG: hemerythrin domain-containing protein [Gammaproteobacteria bacterium]|nr:hemerythrin domain-containing protein [Gammaproteobacteria bacterium]
MTNSGSSRAFIDSLRDEHHYFRSLLDIGREQQVLLKKGGRSDLGILQQVLQYLAEYPEDYHHPREDLLFDRLRALDPDSESALDALLTGHEAIHRESNRLYFTVMRLNNGERISRDRLARDLEQFIDAYEQHMLDEDDGIFLRATEMLADADWAALDDELEEIEDPLFGTRVRRRYRRLANYLEARLGVARNDFAAAEFLTLSALLDGVLTVSDLGINLGFVLRDKAGQTWRENLAAARDTVDSASLPGLAGLPLKMADNAFRNMRGGMRESGELIRRAAEDLRTPYTMRMDALKNILREDWVK